MIERVSAFVTSVLAGYAAFEIMPDTPVGKTAAFALWLVALYALEPLIIGARQRPARYHWIGGAVALPILWLGATARSRGWISPEASTVLGTVTLGLLVVLVAWLVVRRQHKGTSASA